MPPCTTIRRITTNLKTKSTQNCQKSKLYGSLTTKNLNKLYSSIFAGGAELGAQGRRRCSVVEARQQQWPAEWAVTFMCGV